MGWLSAGDTYEVSLVEHKVVARRGSGRPLKTLPKALRDHPEVDRLRQLAEWLDRHSAACLAQVDAWMVSSVPVPTALLGRIWPDPAWQDVLRDLVVVGDDEEAGFLRDVTGAGELRVVDLDGETLRLAAETVTLPHPILLPDLDELRDFAADLGVTQRVEQLHRATWAKPADVRERATEVTDFDGAKLPSRATLLARATALGCQVSGSIITCRVYESGRIVEATGWLDGDYWSDWTMGSLSWRLRDGRQLRLPEVGPVAWSEGMRMAAALGGGQPVEAEKGA
ncbi:DUF4132 domain-containing protein [Plantactinospora mayteni]|uniref:DUF4132 domain-containing protein n=1 Tax=Plantactinospora mayteni TaxID=566021 RepID=A0ABQ4ERL3_9ACTN|nr:DUF4132 domain-containing protein [Plantactinospora mayteni]GIG97307.1 hypothetical protein Pma05_38800 [Plantactinospora mayteni]